MNCQACKHCGLDIDTMNFVCYVTNAPWGRTNLRRSQPIGAQVVSGVNSYGIVLSKLQHRNRG